MGVQGFYFGSDESDTLFRGICDWVAPWSVGKVAHWRGLSPARIEQQGALRQL